ncbi:MAG TPA: ankyrin repeat domain-containing protein, partial [Pyrinomonadaceae bacterium]|nr:ankyrin repeat domain-containing protein [Pyrinomonadaceae bacterium]
MKRSAIFLPAILMIFFFVTGASAQTAATKRLDVAVNGFELNEAAAKDALDAGADINWQNDAMSGETMLITAIKGFKDAKVIKFLVENGADPNIKDDSGKTALEWARQYNIGRDRN